MQESCRTRTVRIFVPLRSVLTEVQWTSSTPSRAMKDSAGLERSRSPLCSGRCRTDIHRMSCTVSRSIRKRLEPIYICKSPAGLERFEVSALLRSVQNQHPPDVVHRLALNQKEVRTDIYARVLPDSNGSYLRSTSVGAGLCFFSFIRDEGVAGAFFQRNKSTYWPLAWLVLNSETHV